jgi:dihydrodipicolinate synthase/N-acetylneuraminate lyase
MLKYRHTYRDDGSFTAWMYHLARRCAADHFRKANAAPYACITIWEAFRTREEEAGMDWQGRIANPAALVTTKYGIPGLKYAMDLNGYYGGVPRLPLIPVAPQVRLELEAAFDGIKG